MFESLETEQDLLGALIHNNAPIIDLDLRPDDFSLAAHADLFFVMKTLYGEKQRFNISDIAVWSAGKERNGVEMGTYVRHLAEAVVAPARSSIESWAQTLTELSRKRAVSDAIAAAGLVLAEKPSSEVIATLQSDLMARLDAKRQKTAETLLWEIEGDLDRPQVFYPTRLRHLDSAMAGGLYKGFTYGLCGKEKAGKTTFAHSISYNLGHSGCKHLYVALEMGAKQIEQRNIARTLGINSLEFINPKPGLREQVQRVRSTSNIVYLDAPGGTLEEILHEIGIARIKHGITGFVIDYWQLVGGAAKGETEERHMRRTAQGFADYARKHGLWCVLLAQMNKDGDLFGGGGLRKACDQLYFIETPSGQPDLRWMRMGASRYTPQVDIGGDNSPKFCLNKKVGPYFEDIYGS